MGQIHHSHAPFLLALLTALFLTATASAADDYSIRTVTAETNAVNVTLTSQADCMLFVALYEESGKMITVSSVPVFVSASEQTIPITFTDSVPVNSYAKAFLLDMDTLAPLCAPGDFRNGQNLDSNVYALLYYDGTMVFQHGDIEEKGRDLRAKYSVNLDGYRSESFRPDTPWYNNREYIHTVTFKDTIIPRSTGWWFCNCRQLENIDHFENLNTADVTDMAGMFYGCTRLASLDMQDWDTSKVMDMSNMFCYCNNLSSLNTAGINTNSVTNMSNMFHGCSNLLSLDVSDFNTSRVSDMSSMFCACSNLESLDVSSWDTSNVTNMSCMFMACKGLTEINVNGFNTVIVSDMSRMFCDCDSLTYLDLSSFNTISVLRMYDMFEQCTNLIKIYATDSFVTTNLTDSGHNMFWNCTSLVGDSGTVYSIFCAHAAYAHIDGGVDNPGYFTTKS